MRVIAVYKEPGKLLSEHWSEDQNVMVFDLVSEAESISGTGKPIYLSASASPTVKSLFRLFQVWVCVCACAGVKINQIEKYSFKSKT